MDWHFWTGLYSLKRAFSDRCPDGSARLQAARQVALSFVSRLTLIVLRWLCMDADLARASTFGQRVESLAHAVKPPICGLLTLRLRLVFSQYLLCRQHNAAIILLFANALDGSARALLRPVMESSLRCEWLLMIATGKDLKRIAGHDDYAWKNLDQMAKALDGLQKADFRMHALQTDKAHIHSFTHGGSQAVARNIKPTGVVGLVPNAVEASDVIRKAALLLANAGISVAHRLRQHEAGRRLSEYASQPWT